MNLRLRLFKLKRKLTSRNIEIYIVSYPKCGRTWLRFILGKYLNDYYNLGLPINHITELQRFDIKNKLIPRFSLDHLGDPHLIRVSDIKVDFKKVNNSKIIFLYRDPRPTAVSNYYQYTFRGDWKRSTYGQFDGAIDDFIKGDVGGIRSIVKYYNIWVEYLKNRQDVLTVSYESLKQDNYAVCTEILRYCQIPIKEELLKSAIEFCKPENLSVLESSGKLNKARFGGEGQSKKVRNVGKRRWEDEIQPDTKVFMEKIVEGLDGFFNYNREKN